MKTSTKSILFVIVVTSLTGIGIWWFYQKAKEPIGIIADGILDSRKISDTPIEDYYPNINYRTFSYMMRDTNLADFYIYSNNTRSPNNESALINPILRFKKDSLKLTPLHYKQLDSIVAFTQMWPTLHLYYCYNDMGVATCECCTSPWSGFDSLNNEIFDYLLQKKALIRNREPGTCPCTTLEPIANLPNETEHDFKKRRGELYADEYWLRIERDDSRWIAQEGNRKTTQELNEYQQKRKQEKDSLKQLSQ